MQRRTGGRRWLQEKRWLEKQGTRIYAFLRVLAIMLLFASMAGVGALIGWLGSRQADGPREAVVDDVQVIELRGINPAQGALPPSVLEVTDAEIIGISLFTAVRAPNDGAATVVIYDYPTEGRSEELRRIDTRAGSWARWDHELTTSRIAVTVEGPRPGLGPTATNVDVLVFADVRAVRVEVETPIAPPASGATPTAATSTRPPTAPSVRPSPEPIATASTARSPAPTSADLPTPPI